MATDIGGIPELLMPEDRQRLLAEPTPKAIANLLAKAIREGLRPGLQGEGRIRPEPQAVDRAWVLWHHTAVHRIEVMLCPPREEANPKEAAPSMTLPCASFSGPRDGLDDAVAEPPACHCLHCPLQQSQAPPAGEIQRVGGVEGGPVLLSFADRLLAAQAIDSVEGGDYKNVEIVVVDDGSTDPDAQRYLEELNLKFQVPPPPSPGPRRRSRCLPMSTGGSVSRGSVS